MKSMIVCASMMAFNLAYAGVEIEGPLDQGAQASNSPMTSFSSGAMSEARTGINVLRGDMKFNGGVKQTYNGRNSPMSAIAVGVGAKAAALVNYVGD